MPVHWKESDLELAPRSLSLASLVSSQSGGFGHGTRRQGWCRCRPQPPLMNLISRCRGSHQGTLVERKMSRPPTGSQPTERTPKLTLNFGTHIARTRLSPSPRTLRTGGENTNHPTRADRLRCFTSALELHRNAAEPCLLGRIRLFDHLLFARPPTERLLCRRTDHPPKAGNAGEVLGNGTMVEVE